MGVFSDIVTGLSRTVYGKGAEVSISNDSR